LRKARGDVVISQSSVDIDENLHSATEQRERLEISEPAPLMEL
jgi:hypothetical protein